MRRPPRQRHCLLPFYLTHSAHRHLLTCNPWAERWQRQRPLPAAHVSIHPTLTHPPWGWNNWLLHGIINSKVVLLQECRPTRSACRPPPLPLPLQDCHLAEFYHTKRRALVSHPTIHTYLTT